MRPAKLCSVVNVCAGEEIAVTQKRKAKQTAVDSRKKTTGATFRRMRPFVTANERWLIVCRNSVTAGEDRTVATVLPAVNQVLERTSPRDRRARSFGGAFFLPSVLLGREVTGDIKNELRHAASVSVEAAVVIRHDGHIRRHGAVGGIQC